MSRSIQLRCQSILGILSILAVYFVWGIHDRPDVGIDDAEIFFSYAENFASGKGMTYAQNGERVEGFTSMLWMLLCALSFAVGLDELGVAIMAFAIMLLTQALILDLLLNCLPKRHRHSFKYPILYMCLLLSSPGYFTWMSITLMDTSLWGLVYAVMAKYIVNLPRTRRSALLANAFVCFSMASRPESMLLVPVWIFLIWLRLKTAPGSCNRIHIYLAGTCILAVAILTLVRLTYFGYPLPNTFYAKVSPSVLYNIEQGLRYLGAFMLLNGVSNYLYILASMAIFFHAFEQGLDVWNKERIFKFPSLLAILALFGCVLLAVPVLAGGDHFQMFRFYQPAHPIICLIVTLWFGGMRINLVNILSRNLPRRWLKGYQYVAAIWSVIFLVLSGSLYSWPSLVLRGSPLMLEFQIAEKGRADGLKLAEVFGAVDAYPEIGVITAGGIARSYPGPIIDLMGLNNPVIALHKGDRRGVKNHAAFEIEPFFNLNVKVLLTEPVGWGAERLKGLCVDPRFAPYWRYGRLGYGLEQMLFLDLMIEQAYLNHLLSLGQYSFEDLLIWSDGWVEPF